MSSSISSSSSSSSSSMTLPGAVSASSAAALAAAARVMRWLAVVLPFGISCDLLLTGAWRPAALPEGLAVAVLAAALPPLTMPLWASEAAAAAVGSAGCAAALVAAEAAAPPAGCAYTNETPSVIMQLLESHRQYGPLHLHCRHQADTQEHLEQQTNETDCVDRHNQFGLPAALNASTCLPDGCSALAKTHTVHEVFA